MVVLIPPLGRDDGGVKITLWGGGGVVGFALIKSLAFVIGQVCVSAKLCTAAHKIKGWSSFIKGWSSFIKGWSSFIKCWSSFIKC